MFDEFLDQCRFNDEINISKKRVKKNIAAVKSLIETEDSAAVKRKPRSKPLLIAAAVCIASAVTLLTVNAATRGAVFDFFTGGEKIEGEYYDYVDRKGLRHISFEATVPLYEDNYAIIYDVSAPREEAVRVITEDTDPKFMEKLRKYTEAVWAYYDAHEYTQDPEDDFPDSTEFGLVFKDSEMCMYNVAFPPNHPISSGEWGSVGGKFMNSGSGHPSAVIHQNVVIDRENETKLFREAFYYYAGKD